MSVIRFIIIVVALGWCFSSECIAAENAVFAMAQANNDTIIAPNVFTPNDDGDNDVFEVTSKEEDVVSLKIYTRAGVLVFSIEAKRCRWDGNSLNGQPLPGGVYYYTAEVRGSSPKVSKCGFVHLYR